MLHGYIVHIKSFIEDICISCTWKLFVSHKFVWMPEKWNLNIWIRENELTSWMEDMILEGYSLCTSTPGLAEH